MNCIQSTCPNSPFTLGRQDRLRIGYDLTQQALPVDLRVVYHVALEINYWSGFYSPSLSQLRHDTESMIRTCHQAALFNFKAIGKHPDVYELGLGSLRVYYTVEPHAVVVRGYSPNLPPDQLDETLAGRVYTEFDW